MVVFRLIAAASTNSTLLKAGKVIIRKIVVSNVSGTVHHLKLYDKATAPTVGTDTPTLTLYTGTSGSSPMIFDFELCACSRNELKS